MKGNAMNENNEDFTNLYESVATQFAYCEPHLLSARKIIEETDLIKKPTKKVLLARIDTIFAEANGIVQKIGQMGKVK
jgi:hypothetical protein